MSSTPVPWRRSGSEGRTASYLALLRGINVGGSNIVRMGDLKNCFESLGFTNVRTYIQSGNVLFETTGTGGSGKPNHSGLTKKVETALASRFKPYSGRIVLRSERELTTIVEKAPPGFGSRPEVYRYDVIFLRPPMKPAEAVKSVAVKTGVDEVSTGPGVLYFSRLIAKAAQSRLARLTQQPVYQEMTVRNWNTTTKLLAMMKEPP